MTSELEKAAVEYRVPETALPPRNKEEQEFLMGRLQGRKEGFLAGAEWGKRWLLEGAKRKSWMMDKSEEQRKAFRLVVLLAELKELVGER